MHTEGLEAEKAWEQGYTMSVSMNLFSSAVLTGCCFVSILQKTPKDVADDSGHTNIAKLLGDDAVSIVSRYTVRILLLLN